MRDVEGVCAEVGTGHPGPTADAGNENGVPEIQPYFFHGVEKGVDENTVAATSAEGGTLSQVLFS